MAEFGTIRGLAVRTTDAAINDLYRMDEANRRSQAIAEGKAKLFADDLEFNTAANSFDNPRIKDYAKSQIAKIGQFVSENPDWATNVNKRMQLNLMKRELKDNPELLRGVASDNAFKQLNADLSEVAKNPQQHDTDAYNSLLEQRNNYLRFGNQDGELAAQKEGPKAFTYQKPRDFINLPETMLKAGNMINPSLVIKGKNMGEFTRTADPNHVAAVKASLWKENARQIQIEAQKLGLDTPEKVDKWLTDGIMAGVKTMYDPGDPDAWFDMQYKKEMLDLARRKQAGKEAPTNQLEPWDDLNNPKKPAGIVPIEPIQKVITDKPKIIVTDNTGSAQIDLTGNKWEPDGRYITDGNGTRRVMGKVKVPIDVAVQTGIWDGDLEDGGISSGFMGKAVRRKDEKGNLFIELNYAVPIDPKNGTMRQLYNAHAQPAKLSTPLTEEEVGVSVQSQPTSWNGYPVGSVIRSKKDGKEYTVTANGPVLK